MQKSHLLTLSGVMAISAVFFYNLKNERRLSQEKYLHHAAQYANGAGLDGPDKSAYRDILMTLDPKSGDIRKENVHEYFKSVRRKRATDLRDFQWEQIDSEIAGRMRTVMKDPLDENKLWAGAVTGGLWYNSDFRNNGEWIPVSDEWESLSISCMSFDPNDPEIFYVGTGESYTSVNIYRESSSSGLGIYKTDDAGATWSLLNSTNDFDYVNDIVIRDEAGKSVIYAGVASGIYQGNVFSSTPSDGLFRSEDGGSSWNQVLPTIPGSSLPYTVSDIELTDNGTLFVGTMRNLELKGGGIVLQSDNGLDWVAEDRYATAIVEEGMVDYGLELLPGRIRLASEGNLVYAVATSGWLNTFNQIRDSGFFTRFMRKEGIGDWLDMENPPNAFWASIPWHALAIKVDPNNANRIAAGGLNVHALSNAESSGPLSWVETSSWFSQYYFSDYLVDFFNLTDLDSNRSHFVHADIHSIEFPSGSSDEVLIATDGGIHYTTDFTKAFEPLIGDRLDAYPSFGPINNSLATTQYYTVALNPEKGNDEVLAGTQDNGTHTSESGEIVYSRMIGGGDGAYCFFDADDPQLRIISSQSNNYYIWVASQGYSYAINSGSFINPAEYDDQSNLLYTNMAVDGGFEVLNPSLEGRFLDTLGVLDINHYLGDPTIYDDTLGYIHLGTNSTAAFSALRVADHTPGESATMVLGNQIGDVYVVSGLPHSPSTRKIDGDQLPVGYISSVDFGANLNKILVTFSNYGTESVWYTRDWGETWLNLERNLPDVPVRHGIFNPLDDDKIIVATEVGIWGLEGLSESYEWVPYNNGLPNVRVDMIKARGSDSTIVAATHGRGLFLGKFNQGEPDPSLHSNEELPTRLVYPNPTDGRVYFNFVPQKVSIYSLEGRLLNTLDGDQLDLSDYGTGLYLIKVVESNDQNHSFKVFRK